MGAIQFYQRSLPFFEFSNFFPAPIELDGLEWPTTEHYYQAMKFSPHRPADVEAVRLCETPGLAFRYAHHHREGWHADWHDFKEDVMRRALHAKFTQRPHLRAILLGTRDRKLVEHTRRDSYWGDGGDGSGANRLGKLLMELRATLAKL